VNTKFIAAISIAAALATLLVYQAFVAGFVVSNQTTGSVVQINSENALLQIVPIGQHVATVSGNGGLSITLPYIAPGTADDAAEIDPPGPAAPPLGYSAAYLFPIAGVYFNNHNQEAALSASLENFQPNNLPIPITILVLASYSQVQQLTFPHNEIQIKVVTPGEVDINGQQFWVLATCPSNIASQIGTTPSLTIGSTGVYIYFLVLLGNSGTLPPHGVTFSAALNLYGYQMPYTSEG